MTEQAAFRLGLVLRAATCGLVAGYPWFFGLVVQN